MEGVIMGYICKWYGRADCVDLLATPKKSEIYAWLPPEYTDGWGGPFFPEHLFHAVVPLSHIDLTGKLARSLTRIPRSVGTVGTHVPHSARVIRERVQDDRIFHRSSRAPSDVGGLKVDSNR